MEEDKLPMQRKRKRDQCVDQQYETRQDDNSQILESNAEPVLVSCDGKVHQLSQIWFNDVAEESRLVQRRSDDQSNAPTSVYEAPAEKSEKRCDANSTVEEAIDITDIPVCSNKEIKPGESGMKVEPVNLSWTEEEENPISVRLNLPDPQVVPTKHTDREDCAMPANIIEIYIPKEELGDECASDRKIDIKDEPLELMNQDFMKSEPTDLPSEANNLADNFVSLDQGVKEEERDRQRRDNLYHRDNMPKTKQTRGRAKQRRPEADRPEAETAERDHSPQSSISSVDVTPETQQDPLESQRQPLSEDEATRQQKKRVRVSKKEIPEYRWTEETELRLAELVKEIPQLYDKRQKEFLNVAAKNSWWDRVGELLEPPAIGPQCKKHYENMRTRVGKIMKKEKKSGAGQSQRSARADQIMETWSFLTQHIVRGETVPSEQFAVPESAAVTISDDDDDEVRSTGSQSQASSTTGKGKGKEKWSRPPTTETATTTADTRVTQSDLSDAVKQILSKVDSLGASHSYTGQQKIVHNFAGLLEGHMQGIPEDSWHEFQIDCLNLVHRYKQRRQLFQQPQQQSPMTLPAPQQQQPSSPLSSSSGINLNQPPCRHRQSSSSSSSNLQPVSHHL